MERGDINLDWFEYREDVIGFDKESYDREYNEKFEFEDDSIIDVTDSYKELSSERIYD